MDNYILNLVYSAIECGLLEVVGYNFASKDEFKTEVSSINTPVVIKFDGKEYNVSLDQDLRYNSEVHEKKFEYLNRGSTLIKDLLYKVFNDYNVLVVKKATSKREIDENVVEQHIPCNSDLFEAEVLEIKDSDDSLKDYKIQLGLTFEIKDSIQGGITPKHFTKNCYVEFDKETGEPKFDFNTELEPSEEDCVINYAEIEGIDKNEYVKRINDITERVSKTETKELLFRRNFEEDDTKELRNYLEERRKLSIELAYDDRPRIDFNVTPVSVSLNKIDKKIPKIKIAKKGDYSVSAIFDGPNIDPFTLEVDECKCPYCGYASTDMGLVVAKGKGKELVAACTKCSSNIGDDQNVDYVINDYIGTDEESGKQYHIDDLDICAISGKNYLKSKLVSYLYSYHPDGLVLKRNKAFKAYVSTCPNCHTNIAYNNVEESSFLYKGAKGDDYVCCKLCLRLEGEYYERGDVTYFLSDITNRAFDPKNSKLKTDPLSGILYEESEGEYCSSCHTFIKTEYYDTCILCRSKALSISKDEVDEEVANVVSGIYGKSKKTSLGTFRTSKLKMENMRVWTFASDRFKKDKAQLVILSCEKDGKTTIVSAKEVN